MSWFVNFMLIAFWLGLSIKDKRQWLVGASWVTRQDNLLAYKLSAMLGTRPQCWVVQTKSEAANTMGVAEQRWYKSQDNTHQSLLIMVCRWSESVDDEYICDEELTMHGDTGGWLLGIILFTDLSPHSSSEQWTIINNNNIISINNIIRPDNADRNKWKLFIE